MDPFGHGAGLPFACAFLDALRADPRPCVQSFTVGRPAARWTALKEWEVVGLALSLFNDAVLKDAAAVGPRITALELVLWSSSTRQIHIVCLPVHIFQRA